MRQEAETTTNPPAHLLALRAMAGVVAAAVVSGLLYGLSTRDYLTFHGLAEAFSILVAFGVFALAWYSRAFLGNNFLLLIGVASLFVGGIDILHTLAYKGMDALPGGSADLAIRFWIAARSMEALSLLAAVAAPTRTYRADGLLVLYGTATAVLLWAILTWPFFPDFYVEGEGLTPLKQAAELAIIGVLAAALAALRRNREDFDERIRFYLTCALASRIASELAFTFYVDVYGLLNFSGHIFKIIAFFCIFRGLVETGLSRPQALIAKSLERERQLSAEIEEQAHMLEAILAASPDLVFLFDRDLRYSYVNPAAAQLMAIPQQDWVGRSWCELGFAPEVMEPFESRLRAAFGTGRPDTGEIAIDDRRYEFKLVPIFDARRRVRAVLNVTRDITERATAEQRLRAALREAEQARAEAVRANDAKTRFIAAASHDLRQPLQAARLYLEMLRQDIPDPGCRGLLKKALEGLDGGEDLLRALLDLSTLQAGTVTPNVGDVAIQAVFDRLVDECAEQAHKKGLEFRMVPCAAILRSDPVLLQRILRNLLTNAIRYTDRGRILVGCRRQGDGVRIDVVDTGTGIPANLLDSIFEEFYQVGNAARNRSEGLGLGLSIVKGMATLLGHTVSVASEPGKGSRFSIRVPRAGDAAAPPPAPAPAADPESRPAPATGRPVLVVEDDAAQLAALRRLLEGWGLTVLPAADAETALAVMAEGTVPAPIPALVITDCRLPGALSGAGLVLEVRRRCGHTVPAVLVTGDTDPRRLREARDSGLPLLHKPYSSERLRELVEAALAAGAGPPPAR